MTTPEYDAHRDHNLSYLPFIVEDGWDARQGERQTCGVTWLEQRAVPAEGVLIDPDPHIKGV